FRVTKAFHNALQGRTYSLTKADRTTYLAYNSLNARELSDTYDFIFVHDPQPAALRHLRPNTKARWIWRCHIDTSNPNPEVWEFLKPFVDEFDAIVFTLREFIPEGLDGRVVTILPAIDPLSPKNMNLTGDMSRYLLNWIGMRLNGPLICQVSRFDPWKDPLGVIETYKLVKRERPDVNLALVGSMALDDPEGWEMYGKIIEAVHKDRDIHVFTNLVGVCDLQVNAFQRLSDVAIQKSIREGFGLVVSETLWKETPMVAGDAGGIPVQMAGGGGFLIGSIEEAAMRVLELLSNPGMAKEEGKKGREYVRKNFLITRLLRDHLLLLSSISK
ncbi:MAG TPA: glycosyltransferase, partial [Anaerolineae bacterium]|nr:glycosyltransferase [Anaerolineae bacterium]